MKNIKYYNQNNYGTVPYPAPGYENATVKSGGCGVCCASMVIENLTGKAFPPSRSAAYTASSGARIPGGTDMRRLGACLAHDFELTVTNTDEESALLSCLNAGGMAIANAGGNRKNYRGVFSDSGHFIVAASANGRQLTILDPGKYEGKFNKPWRAAKVSTRGNLCFCSVETLSRDCLSRSPRYYLFTKKQEVQKDMTIYKTMAEVPAWGRAVIEKLVKKGAIQGTGGQLNISEDLVRTFVILDRLGKL